jgi:hypothetical protein
MSVPLRKDEFEEENLTTADLAQGKRPASEDRINEDRIEEDRINEDRAEDRIKDRLNDRTNAEGRANEDRMNEDRMNEDRPGPVLAERARSEGAQAGTAAETTNATHAADTAPLFPSNELEELRSRWNNIQTAFVDEPRRAVEQADGLVASAMKRLAEVFAQERSKLEQQWDRGDNVSTEDLRVALQRYRAFFQRLLSI